MPPGADRRFSRLTFPSAPVPQPVLLALESSCDETAAAICALDGTLLASRVASQVDIHRRYGGVVPEVASRNHILQVRGLVEEVLAE